MLGAEIGDELGDLLVAERVAERGHFVAAVEDLIGHFFRRPVLVVANVEEGWRLFGADAAGAVAIGAALVAEEEGAGLRIGVAFGGCVHGKRVEEKNG